MAKRGRPKSGRVETTARIEAAIKCKAKTIADHRGISIGQVLSEAARQAIDRQYLQVVREMERSCTRPAS